MRISDWSSDVCSADLVRRQPGRARTAGGQGMNPLPLARIAQWSGGRLQGADVLIDAIETDTRALDVDDGRSALFVALKGERFDGHDHVASASDLGVSAALGSPLVDCPLPPVMVADPHERKRAAVGKG